MGAEEYVQVHTPDKIEIAHLVSRAKGLKRTMAQFSEACGISPSTLSRIVNGKISKPLSYDTILKIYNCRYTAEDEFLFELLIRANGMKKKAEHEGRLSKMSFYARKEQLASKKTLMKNTVVTELFDRGIPVVNATQNRYLMDDNTTASEIFPGRIGDMAVELDNKKPSTSVWAFYWFPQEPEDDDEQLSTPKQITRRIIDAIAMLLLVDAWQPEIIKGLKTSFVFSNEEVFRQFLLTLKDAQLNTEMSALLLDLNAGCILEERWLPSRVTPKRNIFDTDKVFPDSQEDIDAFFYSE